MRMFSDGDERCVAWSLRHNLARELPSWPQLLQSNFLVNINCNCNCNVALKICLKNVSVTVT